MNTPLFAGEGVVGNGGNVIFCDNVVRQDQNKFHNKTLELFELEFLFSFNENLQLHELETEVQVLNVVLNRLKKINFVFYNTLKKEINDFSINSKHFDFEFNFSNDLDQSAVPDGCYLKTIIFQKEKHPYYLISKLWRNLPLISKASLKLHEVIYRYKLSNNPVNTTSLPVRKLNAFLFSKEFFFSETSSETLEKLIKQLEY
jgi:hypothetical protein